jgi:beta-glucanase (GH16 family)
MVIMTMSNSAWSLKTVNCQNNHPNLNPSENGQRQPNDRRITANACSKICSGFFLLLGCSFLSLIFGQSASATPPPGYTMAFDEEFSGPLAVAPGVGWGPLVSPQKWIAHTPYAGDFGNAYFTGPNENATTPSPFSVSNGILTISAYQDPMIANHWRSGLLSSADTRGGGFSQALGYWECRMMLPSGQGVWPAFWLAGVNGISKTRTTNSAEIDILEAFGIDMTIAHHYTHIWAPNGSQVSSTGAATTQAGMTTGFHVYGCLVNPDFIHFYYDGVEVANTPTLPEEKLPLYVMIDLALGNGFPIDIPSPTKMYVDYIQAYAPPAAPAPSPSPSPIGNASAMR